MTLQEAINKLKITKAILPENELSKALETVISAYEVTDEQIHNYADSFCITNDEDEPGTTRVESYAWHWFIEGAKAFRDGKISKP